MHPCTKCGSKDFIVYLLSFCARCMKRYIYCEACGGIVGQVKDRDQHFETCNPERPLN